ncbi:MAG: hypothetical protein M3381_10440 [Actinomycetota bacterium]|nr:hypothetical protein [Actinomycetota bacterium]
MVGDAARSTRAVHTAGRSRDPSPWAAPALRASFVPSPGGWRASALPHV